MRARSPSLRLAGLLAFALLGASFVGCEGEVSDGGECAGGCADGNPCTINRCVDGECEIEASPEGILCSDGDACNGVEVCDGAGVCADGEPVITNDGDTCTTDACDPATGEVTHTPIDDCEPPAGPWEPLPTAGAPTARDRFSLVWTGSEMIVWGGNVGGEDTYAGDGAAYDPAARTWRTLSAVGAPSARQGHVGVWTGTRMLVWGGFGENGFENTGGLYDPMTDTWTAMGMAGAPAGRTQFAAAWSGDALYVHGGTNPNTLADAHRWESGTNAWASLPAGMSVRYGHSGTWAGDRLVLWGGNDLFDWHDDGVMYVAGAWTPTASSGKPGFRQDHSATWTGDSVMIWGGWNGGPFLDTGALFDPDAGTNGAWTATSQVGAPTNRAEHVALWTGTHVVIWGGCGDDSCLSLRGDGARLAPDASGGVWSPLPTQGALSPRRNAQGVWTGSRVLIWGGRNQAGRLATGAALTLD